MSCIESIEDNPVIEQDDYNIRVEEVE